MGGNWFGSGIYATEEALAKALGTKKGGATYKLFLKILMIKILLIMTLRLNNNQKK